MILLRVTEPDVQSVNFAAELEQASGIKVALLLDERGGPKDAFGLVKVSLSAATLGRLNLHLTNDVAWRCGDYGYYVARRLYPCVEKFWMIEYDVRIRMAGTFFAACCADESDVLVADFRPAGKDWFWTDYLIAQDIKPWRCFFPVSRLSARAIDYLYQVRIEHSKKWFRKWAWPNDEGFVATTVANSELKSADFNSVIADAWSSETYRYGEPMRNIKQVGAGDNSHLLHPVLVREDAGAQSFAPRHYLSNRRRRLAKIIARTISAKRRWSCGPDLAALAIDDYSP